MNENQAVSLITLVVGGLSGFAIQKGYVDKDTAAQIGAGAIALAVALFAHLWHKETPVATTTAPASGSSAATKLGLFFALGTAAVLFTGCASAPTTAYKVEGATAVSVTAAASLWNSYVAVNHPSAAVELQVRSAFEKYQAAELLAIDVTASYASLTATNAPLAASSLASASTGVSTALADLVTLLESVGIKI